MDYSRWVTFACYCVMSFILGMHYFNIYPNIKALGEMFEGDINEDFKYIYPIMYIILGPLCYRIIWKSFYWSNCFSWLCVIISVWLKFFKTESKISEIMGHVILVACTSLVIPGTGVLAVKYFRPNEYFFVLIFSSLSHLIGIIFGKILKFYMSDDSVFLSQGVIAIIVSMVFVVFSDPEPLIGYDDYESFFGSLRILLKNSDRGILFFSISAQIGFIYYAAVDSYTLANMLFNYKGDQEDLVYIELILFCAMGVIGGLLILFMIKQSMNFGVIVRLYLGLPFLMIFLLNFVFGGRFFFTIMSLICGLTILPSIAFMQIIGLSTHKKIIQPISINLSYYFSSLFLSIFRYTGATLQSYGIYGTYGANLFQLLILTCFLSVYERGIESRFLRKSKY